MILTYFVVQEDQLIVNAMDLFSAGSETTATTLAWAVAFMIIEPEVILIYMFSTVDGGYRQCQNLDYSIGSYIGHADGLEKVLDIQCRKL